MMSIREKLLLAVERYRLLASGDRVLVGVSGGQDSVALLALLTELREALEISLVVAHLHHGMRGEAADHDLAKVEELARRLQCKSVAEWADVPGLARARRVSVEVAGREARYDFFRRAAVEHHCSRVALGHTATDRAETLLMNLFRGAGLAGLASIPPRRDPYVRPLILVTRQETGDFCRSEGLAVCTDCTNSELRFQRNRVRESLLPQLEREYGPGVAEALSRAADHAWDELAWTEPLVEAAWARCGGSNGLRVVAVQELPAGLQQRVLRRFLRTGGHAVTDLSRQRWGELAALVAQDRTGKRVELGGGWSVQIEYGVLRLQGPTAAPAMWEGEVCLPVPGAAALPDGRCVVAEVAEAPPADSGGSDLAVLDAELAGDDLRLRLARTGDRFVPSGMAGHKKLQDFFVDNKVPPRDRRPLVLIGHGGVLWVAGHRLAETARPHPGTRRFLVVRVTAAGAQNG
jgi:tRNA(Ile)-lysidine synthase